MVERVGLYTDPLLGVEGDPYAGTVNPYTGVNPAAQSGLDALRSGLVDQAVSLDQPVERSRFEMAGGLSTPPSEFGMAELEAFQRSTTPLEFAQSFQAPQQAQPTQGIRLGFDPDQGKYLINNTVVDTRDIQGLQRVPELIQEPLSPELPAGNWRPIDIQTLKRNKDELLTLSFGERVGLGAQQVAGSIPTGFGRLAEFAGAEGVGEALVGLGERLGMDEFDEARLAAITESENIVQSIVGAVPQGIPSIVTSVGSAIVGGAVGGFATGGPIGATIGALIGGASTIFPQMVTSAYDTALRQQGEDFVESDRGKAEILGTAFATTGIQMIPGMQVSGRVVPMLMQRAATQVANKATSGVAGTAARVGFAEGMAEMMALVTEQVVFDPETRQMMSEGEVAAMLPYVADVYGREAAVAFSAGAILGGGIGAVTGAITRQPPSEETNLLVPTDEAPSGPEFTGELRGVGPQGVLPMEGLGGQIERAKRSRQVGYQPPKEGEQSNLLERPPTAQGEPQLSLDLQEPAPIQGELFPAPGEQRLRRGVQPVEDVIPPPPPIGVGPAQGEMFTRRGQPTAAARVSTEPPVETGELIGRADGSPFKTRVSAQGQINNVARRRNVPADELEVVETDQGFFVTRAEEEFVAPETAAVEPAVQEEVATPPVVEPAPVTEEAVLPEGVPDAIQEPSPAEVPARERTGISEEVGARIPSVAEPARAREEEAIIQQAQEEARQQDVRAPLTPPLSPSQQNRLRRQRRKAAEPAPTPTPRTAESAWEFLKPEGAGEFVSLRPALQDIWTNAFEQNVITAELAGQINRLSVTPSNMQKGLPTLVVDDTGVARIESILESEYREATFDNDVNDLVDSLDVVRDITKLTYNRKVYENTIAELIDAIHLPTGISELKAATRARVQKALTDLPLSSIFVNGMYTFANNLTGPIDAQRIPLIIDRMNEAGLIKDFNNRYGFTNLPEDLQVPIDKVPVDPATGEDMSTKDVQADALALERNINLYNNEEFARNPAGIAKAEQKLIELYERVVDEGLQDFIDARGNPLSAYFNEDGTPKLVQRDGRTRVVTDETAPARLMTDVLDLDDYNGEIDPDVARAEDELGGAFSTADGTPITRPMEIGRVRMLVNTFKNKLRVKPKTFVFRTQADLQAKNPALYARAVAARPQGDFDTKVAAGYSFGSGDDATVIIFSDRIRGNQHLNFVLAHETIGHFGMRSLLSQARFKSVMEGLYEDSGIDTNLRFQVDAAMAANPKLSRAQAVEEYLADFAGRLDTNIVRRIYNAIKGVLNRLGVQFSDDAARYLIGHARDYVRLGEVSSMFDAAKVATRIQELNGGMDPDGTGRFSSSNTVGMLHAVAAFIQAPRWGDAGRALASGDHHEAVKAAMEAVRKTGINVKSDWEGIKRQIWRLSTYVKRENPGLEQVFGLFDRGTKEAYRIQNDFNERLKLVFDRSMFDKVADLPVVGGATSTQIDSINENLYGSLMKNRNSYTPTMLGVEPLYTILDGEYIKNTPEINRLFDLGTLSFEEMRDGYSYELTDGSVIEVEGIPDLTPDDIRYKGYLDVMEALRDLQLEKVRASMQAAVSVENDIFGKLDSIMQSGELEPQQRQFLESMHRIFVETYYADPEFITGEDGVAVEVENVASMQSANDFLVALNTALIAEEPAATDTIAAERNANVIAALRNMGRDIDANTEAEILQNIEDFKAARVGRNVLEANEQLYAIQTAFKAAQAINGEVENVMKTAKRNIAVGYVPFVRRGDYEMAVEFYDRSGNKVFLTQEFKDSVVYRQFETEGDAVTVTNKVNELFDGVYNKVLIKNSDEAIEKGEDPVVEAEVTARAVARKTLDTVAAPTGLDLATVTTFLHRFSIGLPPAKMQEIIVDLTTSEAAVRSKLQAQGTPGYDPNAIRAMAEFVRKESSAIVKIQMRPELNRILDQSNPESMKLWRGDPAKLERLRTTWENLRDDPTATKQAKQIAKIEYDQYNYQYNKTNPPRKDGVQQRADQWKGYYNEAQTLVQFLNNNQNLNESDFGDSKYIALLRASTSIAMLGMSVATASLNFVALPTNFIPYMAAKNSDTGFGGGFNGTDVIRELTIALKQVGTLKARTPEYYDNLATDQAALDKAGLTVDEARFVAGQIRSGVAIPAQTNQLQQTALDKITSAFWQKFWQGYMWTFNSSERSSRRAAVLTAYRMERNRRLEAGYSPEQAQELARVFAENAIDLTLGNYATYVRPKFFRDGPAGLLFIFNTFPFMSIQTLSHLPRDGKIKMLAALFVFSGVSGFPFAEDLEDIIDTIAQRLGLPMGSIRAEAAKLSDAIIPGSSRFVLNGLMRDLIPADVAGRTSLGNVAPATAIGLPGSSAIREVTDLLGPAASMIQGVFATTSTLAKATYRPEVTFNDALRISPVTAFRLVGDSWSYYNTGAITDRRGYIVSPEMNAGIILTRLFGFYPTAAAEQYQTIMVAKRITDYQRQISAGFRIGWVKAKMAGNERRAKAIMEAARDWNKSNKDMQVNIKGWSRALSEARRPAAQRQLRSAPVSARQELERTGRLLLSD